MYHQCYEVSDSCGLETDKSDAVRCFNVCGLFLEDRCQRVFYQCSIGGNSEKLSIKDEKSTLEHVTALPSKEICIIKFLSLEGKAVTCSNVDFSSFIDNFSEFPPIEH